MVSKGVLHTTGGYMVYSATTFKYAFDYKPSDVYWYPWNSTCLIVPLAFSVWSGSLTCSIFIFEMFLGNRCTADCGWITGHSYVTYGPMLNGASVVVFEGVTYFELTVWKILIYIFPFNQRTELTTQKLYR